MLKMGINIVSVHSQYTVLKKLGFHYRILKVSSKHQHSNLINKILGDYLKD
jgi:hypothetical protein